ncbi:MAG: hypothetical protein PWQ57_2987 [Desulfovibrionales bacterium]|jgi:hypothetical protein|nr:hypothetical protein [Desulfovibrionales bacterium]
MMERRTANPLHPIPLRRRRFDDGFFSNPGEAMALQATKDAVKDRT